MGYNKEIFKRVRAEYEVKTFRASEEADLRREELYAAIPAVKEYMNEHYASVPKHYLVSDICRPELLIEIEGVAHI